MLQAPSLLQHQQQQQYGGYPSQSQQTSSYYRGGGTTSTSTDTAATNNVNANNQAFRDGVRNNVVQSAGNNQPFNPSYTSAPYSHPSLPATAAQPRQSASPTPNARLSPPNNPNIYPMAAPPLPQTPTDSPNSPSSNANQTLEQKRITLLFQINVELLQEVNRLQSLGQGGAISPQQQAALRKEGKSDKMASDEYIQCLRRVQANLAFLMPLAQSGDGGSNNKQPPGPAHMTPPPHMAQLQGQYEQLRELFPGWSGMDHRPSQSQASNSPQPNGMAAAQA